MGLGGPTDIELLQGEQFEVINVVLRNNVIMNGTTGAVAVYDAQGAYIANNLVQISDPKKLVVLHGLNDFIVVDTGDVLLICKMENEQQIRTIVSEVKKNYGNHLT